MKIVFETIEIRVINEPIVQPAIKSITGWWRLLQKYFKARQKLMRNKKTRLNQMLAMFLALMVIMVNGNYTFVAFAQTAPTPASEPTAPTPPPQPETTIAPSPTPLPEPTPPAAPRVESVTGTTQNTTETSKAEESDETTGESSSSSSEVSSQDSTTSESAPITGTGGQNNDATLGSATINTGDANNVGNISTSANTNVSLQPSTNTDAGGIKVINSGNGTDSTNSGSVTTANDNSNLQTNSATVGNNLYQETVSGENSSSENTGGNTTITTGDANTSGTILTGINTNLDGVSLYEFNIADDYTGDYVLDFSSANCISGCTPGTVTVVNADNGSDSTNTGNVDTNVNDATFQTNDATLENNMFLASNSGENEADKNTGGDSTIQTGGANVSGNVVNMVNNNIAGNVVLAVVNIFGNLIGDIILPDGSVLSCCVSSVTTANAANGADSTNTASVDQTTSSNTYQFNNVDIQNNIVLDAQTGGNDVSKNTSGDNSVTTGDANIVGQVLNVANTNLVGGNWWLVLVNEAGRWIGKIIGADGSNYAGSDGFEFIVDENGEITVVNSGNGTGSTNTGTVSQTTNTTTVQNNDAQIVNNVNLSANSGGNSATKNTGGNSTITTGDANIVANIVNFVNNNIVGGGKLFVTVINVFGSWLGDFVGPGQAKENDNSNSVNGLGGASNEPTNQSSNSSSADSIEAANDSEEVGTGNGNTLKVSTKKVLGLFASAKTSSDDNSSIALANNENEGVNTTAAKKVIKINLAWLTLLLPFGAYFIIRRKSLALKTSVRKV